LHHSFQQIESDTRFRLVLRDRDGVDHVEVTYVRRVGVTMYVRDPLPFNGVCVSGAGVFLLKMIHLGLNIVTFSHDRSLRRLQELE